MDARRGRGGLQELRRGPLRDRLRAGLPGAGLVCRDRCRAPGPRSWLARGSLAGRGRPSLHAGHDLLCPGPVALLPRPVAPVCAGRQRGSLLRHLLLCRSGEAVSGIAPDGYPLHSGGHNGSHRERFAFLTRVRFGS